MDKLPNWHLPELLASYEKFGGLNDRNAHNTPSKRAIGQICEDLRQRLPHAQRPATLARGLRREAAQHSR
jgi:hypothetical protein